MKIMICYNAKDCKVHCAHKESHQFNDSILDGKCDEGCTIPDGIFGAICIPKLTYPEWKLELIRLIVDETRVEGYEYKIPEISCVLYDDCDYPLAYKNGETPEEVWQGEIDAIGDSQ
jgi:hypothetical protein